MSCSQKSNSKFGSSTGTSKGQKFTQKVVSQNPVYDKVLKVHRPNKRIRKAGNFL